MTKRDYNNIMNCTTTFHMDMMHFFGNNDNDMRAAYLTNADDLIENLADLIREILEVPNNSTGHR